MTKKELIYNAIKTAFDALDTDKLGNWGIEGGFVQTTLKKRVETFKETYLKNLP